MAGKSLTTPGLKPTRSANIEQYLSPKKASTLKTAPEDNLDQASPSTRKGELNESQDKPDNSVTANSHVALVISDPLASSPSRPGSTRKRASDVSTADASTTKKRRPSKRYAPPSTYAHLSALPDTITPNLLCLFVGLNPGIQTATQGHPYAHPSNLFWRLLHSSGLTPQRRLAPAEYVVLPEQYSLGNTNIVGRATKDASELSKEEMVAGAAVLDEKVRRWRPEVVCLVGKGIWEAVWKWKYGRAMRQGEFQYGFQEVGKNMGMVGFAGQGAGVECAGWGGARVFVATSTSGLAASLSLEQKEDIWAQLGMWVNRRREEGKRAEGGQRDELDCATVKARQ